MFKSISIFIFLLLSLQVVAQREAAHWFFGNQAGLDFNSGFPVIELGSRLESAEGCSTISDKDGNLLFYTDGNTVWNKSHQVMLNGTGLLGHYSSTQAAMIVPKPGSRSIYYIFTVDKPSFYLSEGDPIDGINFSEIDMNLDGGLGGLVTSQKNQHLITYDSNNAEQKKYKSSEKITAVLHNDGSSFWVITHFVDKFYAFKVDQNGVNTTPVISTTSQKINPILDDIGINKSAIGYLKVSPNGEKLAIAHSSTSLGSFRSGTRKNGRVYLYDFNIETGKVGNGNTLINNEYPYGVEFSPKSNKLYITSNIFDTADNLVRSNLYQFDMTASNIQGSKKTINQSVRVAGALQLAIDGKVYRAGYPKGGSTTNLSVINKPDNDGPSCEYYEGLIKVGKPVALGLPPFIASFFIFTFDYEFVCFGDNTHFYITSEEPFDTVLWDFGDGTTSTEVEPYHTYSNPGDYQVTLTKFIGGVSLDPIIKTVTIFTVPDVPSTIYDLVQCDAYDAISDDGLSTFNLELANDFVSNESIYDIDVFYYSSETSAENDIENRYAIDLNYENVIPNEILYAKVIKKGSDCYSISRIRLIANTPIDLSMPDLFSCDLGDGTGEFDLDSQRQIIISNFALPTNSTISFHRKKIDAELAENHLENLFISPETMIYIRGEVDGTCLGIGTMNLKIHAFPSIIEYIEIDNCFNNFPLMIDSGILLSNQLNFSFDWGNGISTSYFEVQTSGEYQLIITDINTDCSRVKTVVVNEIPEPIISDIKIDDVKLGHNITIEMSLNGDYLYALDNILGPYQSSSSFLHIIPGDHIVYVKGIDECIIIEQEFFILGYPKFFTPNNDNSNDSWQITGYDKNVYSASDISIFNRFGKLIAQVDPLSLGWDGYYNGDRLPSSDYWFSVELKDLEGNIRITRGHFSLVRR